MRVLVVRMLVVMEVGEPWVFRDGGHLVGGDVWRAALLQARQRAGVGRLRRRLLPPHVEAGGRALVVVLGLPSLEGAGLLVELAGGVILLWGIHGASEQGAHLAQAGRCL